MVKRQFKALVSRCTCPPDLPQCVCHRQPLVRLITRKVMRPTDEEIARNPMARSTRLREWKNFPKRTRNNHGRSM